MNDKKHEIQRKHHYVWAQYLKQWAHNNKIWYISSKGGNIRLDSIYGRSQERFFYKITPLDEVDIQFIERFPTTNSPTLKKFHASQLEFFKTVSMLINAPSTLGNIVIEKDIAQLKHMSEWASNNPLEQTYTAIELLARPIIDELWNGDDSCLKIPSNMVAFCNYLAHQLARTRKMRDKTFDLMINAAKDSELWLEHMRLLKKNWWFIAYAMGNNLGYGLQQSLGTANFIFIKNTTNIDFITSDHPVINVHQCAQDLPAGKTVEKLDLYYPLSPKLAYMINDSQYYNQLTQFINEEDVIHLNRLMAKHSHNNIYGSTEQALKDVRKSYRNLKA
ncbi:hypothetical protein C9I50_00460 [Pseudomonas prosekii]|uniref:DUF4238 domain-containing protein n=1 Tax=Pseudomonas prosekii TaxID=1148509 RepID=UPI000D6126D9|nr:DUF4238 domain-containing protein [Pseudomonas prosekii]PWE46188.1 hypothetical protein C9I50_00460 [Pseudomonas prosekii]